ncbi:MAG TPA: RNA polymerase sigma factor [Solirubrobacteraceae bacterium]|jgi:RNA polymerase sigma-70 factor (ECF subfamily)|nr:RNA polymerase sigma factor [Solirubrobacteraceae bacterium]
MTQPDAQRRERFELLFERHHPDVVAYVVRRAPRAAVEDVVSDTFLVAWRALDGVPQEPLPWLYGVARRTLANHRRGRRRSDALSARLMYTATPPLEQDVLGEGVAPPLREALLALSEREREAVLLVAWEGLSPAQAASALGCSGAAFRVRLHRARGRLAQLLARTPSERSPQAGCALIEPLSEGGER